MATTKPLHPAIVSPILRESILEDLNQSHAKYVTATRGDGSRLNCRDNVWIVSKPYIFGRLFDPVMEMNVSGLIKNSEWIEAFPSACNGFIPDKFGVYDYGKSIFDEFYDSLIANPAAPSACLRCGGDGYVIETDWNGTSGLFPCDCQ